MKILTWSLEFPKNKKKITIDFNRFRNFSPPFFFLPLPLLTVQKIKNRMKHFDLIFPSWRKEKLSLITSRTVSQGGGCEGGERIKSKSCRYLKTFSLRSPFLSDRMVNEAIFRAEEGQTKIHWTILSYW